jgi:hypothetical protein
VLNFCKQTKYLFILNNIRQSQTFQLIAGIQLPGKYLSPNMRLYNHQRFVSPSATGQMAATIPMDCSGTSGLNSLSHSGARSQTGLE